MDMKEETVDITQETVDMKEDRVDMKEETVDMKEDRVVIMHMHTLGQSTHFTRPITTLTLRGE